MKQFVRRYGPVVINWFAFSRSIIDQDGNPGTLDGLTSTWDMPCPTNATGADHVGLLVGWTRTHWIVKNSWGSKHTKAYPDEDSMGDPWGIDGYLYMNKSVAKGCFMFEEMNMAFLDGPVRTRDLY